MRASVFSNASRYTYQVEDIRQFRDGVPPDPSQDNRTAANQAVNPPDFSRKIAHLLGQRSTLANMDGSVDRELAHLERKQLQLQSTPAEHASSSYPVGSLARPLASQVTTASSSRGKGKERMLPDLATLPLSSRSMHNPQAVRPGFQSTPPTNTPANVPDRDQGVKMPDGVHLLPEIKQQILAYSKDGLLASQIAKLIPGLERPQARAVIRNDNPRRKIEVKASAERRARELTKRDDATSGEYRKLMSAALAQKLTGQPDSTAADYKRNTSRAQAVRELGVGTTVYAHHKFLANEKKSAALQGIDVREVRALRRRTTILDPGASTARTGVETGQSSTPSTGRPTVTLANSEEARTRSWNLGDRFSFPGPNGQLQYFQVTRNRLANDEIYPGDFHSILMDG